MGSHRLPGRPDRPSSLDAPVADAPARRRLASAFDAVTSVPDELAAVVAALDGPTAEHLPAVIAPAATAAAVPALEDPPAEMHPHVAEPLPRPKRPVPAWVTAPPVPMASDAAAPSLAAAPVSPVDAAGATVPQSGHQGRDGLEARPAPLTPALDPHATAPDFPPQPGTLPPAPTSPTVDTTPVTRQSDGTVEVAPAVSWFTAPPVIADDHDPEQGLGQGPVQGLEQGPVQGLEQGLGQGPDAVDDAAAAAAAAGQDLRRHASGSPDIGHVEPPFDGIATGTPAAAGATAPSDARTAAAQAERERRALVEPYAGQPRFSVPGLEHLIVPGTDTRGVEQTTAQPDAGPLWAAPHQTAVQQTVPYQAATEQPVPRSTSPQPTAPQPARSQPTVQREDAATGASFIDPASTRAGHAVQGGPNDGGAPSLQADPGTPATAAAVQEVPTRSKADVRRAAAAERALAKERATAAKERATAAKEQATAAKQQATAAKRQTAAAKRDGATAETEAAREATTARPTKAARPARAARPTEARRSPKARRPTKPVRPTGPTPTVSAPPAPAPVAARDAVDAAPARPALGPSTAAPLAAVLGIAVLALGAWSVLSGGQVHGMGVVAGALAVALATFVLRGRATSSAWRLLALLGLVLGVVGTALTLWQVAVVAGPLVGVDVPAIPAGPAPTDLTL